MMGKALLKNVQFMLGSIFLFSVLAASILYTVFFQDHIPVADLTYGENGDVLARPPYSPLEHPPFGTDNVSQDLFFLLLVGAKYTLGIALLIAFARFALSFLLGVGLQLYAAPILKRVKPLLEGFFYFPAPLLAYLILSWVLMRDLFMDSEFSTTFTERVAFEVVILILIGVPITMTTIAREVEHLQEREFITSAKVLGGSRLHMLKKHLMPYLQPQLFLVFIRELILVLLLLAHLGILNVLFGGVAITEDMFGNSVFVSLSNEWSGLIGNNLKFIFTTYAWIPLVPIICFTVTILSLKMMVEGFQVATERASRKPRVVRKEKENQESYNKQINNRSFESLGG
ncbi:peptide ABC transporter permease [Guptibacillus algicola]|uniref:peptide ABC transporter permease n=1 Tax=Guptibacillus algicola TaxID=225844 RepID=UPI001CD33FA8|nr:peptide ABC transporter permease [Alkalihalobacillus algicola]MCA0987156.1 peptide ABC transporter permease [Alkalihalobacillus algicola]